MTDNVSETVTPTAPPAAAPAAQESEVRTVGPREGLGAGIVGLGILLIALPLAVGSLPPGADPAGAATLLAGMMMLLGIFVIIAGVASFVVKD